MDVDWQVPPHPPGPDPGPTATSPPRHAPGTTEPEPTEPDPAGRRPGFHWMDIVFGLDLALVGLLMISNIILLFQATQGQEVGGITPELMWINAIGILVVLGIIPVVWVGMTRNGGWRALPKYFHLRDPGISVAWGVALAIAWVVAMALVGWIIQQFGADTSNENLAALADRALIPAAIAASFAAGFGEELFFRGFLQKHIGIIGQAAVFGVFHIWQGIAAVLITFLAALALGYLLKRGVSMWTLIWGHVFFDLIVFGFVMAGA